MRRYVLHDAEGTIWGSGMTDGDLPLGALEVHEDVDATIDYVDVATGELVQPACRIRPSHVDHERDRRINEGFEFHGVVFQSRPSDQLNIAGAAMSATLAITAGAQPGNTLWHGGETPFVWIAADNSTVEMDAHTVVEFGQAAMRHKTAHIMRAREFKDRLAAGETIDIEGDWF